MREVVVITGFVGRFGRGVVGIRLGVGGQRERGGLGLGEAPAEHIGDVGVLGGPVERIACDLLAVSGGFTPTVHLFSHARGKLAYNPEIASFVPGAGPASFHVAGTPSLRSR